MHTTLYGSQYYGTFRYGITYELDISSTLAYHITDIKDRYCFYWEINPESMTPVIDRCDWELQISPTPDFANYYAYDKSSALVFSDGGPTKSFDITISNTGVNDWTKVYARVRAIYGDNYSPFSPVITVSLFPDYIEAVAVELLRSLSGGAYDKDPIELTPAERTSNLFMMFRMYATEIDKVKVEIEKSRIDKSLSLCRDEFLYDNFGAYFSLVKPLGMTFTQYRQVLRHLMGALPYQGTVQSVIDAVIPFTGVSPILTLVRDSLKLVCVDSQSNPRVSYINDSKPPSTVTLNNAGYGIKIYLYNPADLTLDLISITNALKKVIPSHVYFSVVE